MTFIYFYNYYYHNREKTSREEEWKTVYHLITIAYPINVERNTVHEEDEKFASKWKMELNDVGRWCLCQMHVLGQTDTINGRWW